MLYQEMLRLQNRKENIIIEMDKLKTLLAEKVEQLEKTMEEITKLSIESGIIINEENGENNG